MKRKLTLLLTVLFTLFTLPVSGLTAFAAEKSYDDIADGTYEIIAKAMHETEDKASGAAGFIKEKAELLIKDGELNLIITVENNDMAEIEGIQVVGKEATIEETDVEKKYTFKLDNLKTELKSQVQYAVPSIGLEHDVPFRFILEGLDELPEAQIETKTETEEESIKFDTVEEEDASLEKDETKVKQEGIDGAKEVTYEVTYRDGKETDRKMIEEKVIKKPVNKIILVGTKDSAPDNEEAIIENPDTTSEVEYHSDIPLETYFNNPVKLIEKDGKKYIQMTGNMGEFIDSLTIDGKDAILGEVKEDSTYTMQFEITKPLSEKLKFTMVIDTGSDYGVMTHDALLWFEGEEEPEPNVEVKSETKTETVKFETVEKKDSSLEAGKTKVKQKGVNGTKEVTYEVTYTDGKESDRKVKSESITKEPVNKIILIGTKGLKDDKLTPDKAYNINYTILHENGKDTSSADGFFVKPGILLEKDGIKYAQFTINNGDMIKELSTEFGDVLVIKENKDGSIVVQFKVSKDLLDMNLTMKVVVPGMYSMEHDAILVFDKDSLQELNTEDYELVASDGDNGPTVKGVEPGKPVGGEGDNGDNGDNVDTEKNTPIKPAFGSNDKDGQEVATTTKDPKNPQTGDTSSVLLYTLLLIGSMVPLAVKFRRRFV